MRYASYYERRNSLRVPLLLRAWVRSDAGPYWRARATEISLTGAQLVLNRKLGLGACLDIQVKFGNNDPYTLRGRVVWTRPSALGGYDVGVSFQCYVTADLLRLRRWHHEHQLLAQSA